MKTPQELQQKVQEIELRMQNIESKPISADGLTVADIISLSKRIDELKAEIGEIKAPTQSESPSCRPAPVLPQQKTFAEQSIEHPLNPAPLVMRPQRKSRFTEGNIGRYVIGVLASLLILLAVGTVASAFWEYVPNKAKFLGLIAIGANCEIIGWRKLQKIGKTNGFWTSVTGLGAAICYAAVIFGQTIWGLYPSVFTGALLLSWFAVNFILSAKANSKVFYVVTYLGGIVAMFLIFNEGGASQARELLIIAAAMVIHFIGKLGFWKTRNTMLPVLNLVFCLTVFQQLQSELFFSTQQYALDMPTLCAAYRPFFLPWFQIILASLILLDMANVWNREWPYPDVISAVFTCIGASMVLYACRCFAERFAPTAQANAWGGFWALIIFTGCIAMRWKQLRTYVLGICPVAAICLVAISEAGLGCASIGPAFFAAGLLFCPIVRRDKYGKLDGLIAYLIAFASASSGITQEGGLQIFLIAIQTVLLVAIPAANYILMRRQGDGLLPELEALVGIACISLAIHPLTEVLELSDALWVLVLAALALGYRYFEPNKPVSKSRTEREIARVGLVAIFVFVVLCSYLGGMIMPDTADKTISTIILMAFSIASLHKAVNERRMGYSIFSAAFCHWNSAFILSMWSSSEANLLVSCAGLLLSAAFIAVGFWKKRKNIRITGLVAMIGYVLKIALCDADAGVSGQAIILLAGGLICFAVSFAYNKLDKLCAETDLEEIDSAESESTPKENNKNIRRRWYL